MTTDEVINKITSMLKANYPMLYIVSSEERRVEIHLREIAKDLKRKLFLWAVTTGLIDRTDFGRENKVTQGTNDYNTADQSVMSALDYIVKSNEAALFVLKDFHVYLKNNPVIVRKLKDVSNISIRRGQQSLIIVSPVVELPIELEKDITIVDFPTPSYKEIESILDGLIKTYEKQGAMKLDAKAKEKIIKAALGLTHTEVENVFAKSLINDGKLDEKDLNYILEEKKQIIRKSGILEYYPTDVEMTTVGGLDELKGWFDAAYSRFSEEARKANVIQPKGVLLIGVPGCGKSMIAKALASLWQMPLLKFDMGRVFGGLVGESEKNMRNAISTAESIAPCILFIDELEKGVSGVSSSGYTDSGTTARVFGTFVTWLQEKKSPVFVIATANNIRLLPPELLRKGRFDEIFFVDLPTFDERVEIFRNHIRDTIKRNPEKFNLNLLAENTDGFSGAEIEQVVKEGLNKAFLRNEEPTTDDIIKSIKETVPLSTTMKEDIEYLRNWAKTRARPASKVKEPVPVMKEEEYIRRLDI